MRKIALLVVAVIVIGGGAYYALTRTASGLSKQQIDLALQKLPPGWIVTYKSIDVGLTSAVLKGVDVQVPGATKVDVMVDEVDVAGPALDLGTQSAEAAKNPASLAPDKALPVANAFTFKGIAVHLDNQDVKVGSAQITKPHLYPWALLHPGLPSYADVVKQLQNPSADPKPEDMLPLLRWEAAIVLGIGYDAYAIDDMSGTAKVATPGSPLTEFSYSAKKAAAGSFDHGKISSVTVDGLAIKSAPEIDATVDHVTMTGMDFHDTMMQALNGGALDPTMLNGLALGKIEYAGITAKTPSGPPVTLSSVAFSNFAFAHSQLVSGDFSVAGLKISKAQVTDPQVLDSFNKLGIDTLTVGFGSGYSWDAEKKTAAVKNLNLKIDELGAVTLSMDLGGVDKPETMAETATLVHALLRYTDASFAGRAMKMAAAESGADPAQFRQQIAGMVQMQSAALNSPAIAAAGKTVSAFLTDPHNLTIELSPPQPLAVATMENDKDLPPDQIFAKLGVKVTANQ